MRVNFTKLIKPKYLTVGISILLFIVPFFWLKSGEMDLGGDSTRLYFYNPLSFLESLAVYGVSSWGTGIVVYNQHYIPFLMFMILLKSLFHSPTILIDIFNGLKLSCSFLFMFLIIKEFLQKEEPGKITLARWSGATLGALLYTLSPCVIDTMRYALITQNQIFLNPMIFYFLLRSLKTSSLKYLWMILFVTLIFSPNFSLQAAPPPLFSFYPLAILFLLLYNFFILKKSFPWKIASVGILFFLGLHAFQLVPVITNVFDKGSEINMRVFEGAAKINPGLEYFKAILGYGKVSEHILLPLEGQKLSWILIIIPTLLILGFLSLRKRNKTILLVSIFFFITMFLVSANITHIGIEFYKTLFYIPGFGMFRNFYGQFQWVYTFFYVILAGITISYLFFKVKNRYVYVIFIFIVGFFVVHGWAILDGKIVNVSHRGSNIKGVIRIDQNYERMLDYIKGIPDDGKILQMPFTDYSYNIVGGLNHGVYIGSSMVALLSGKNDFSGYQNVDPFSEVFIKLAKEKNYPLIKQMMSLLQIRYVLYNSDELVSDKFFPAFPYGYAGTPTSQSGLRDFVSNISGKKIYEAGHYSILEVAKGQYLPHFYAPSTVFFYDNNPKYDMQYYGALSFFPQKPIVKKDVRLAFMDRQACRKIFTDGICGKNELDGNIDNLRITYQRINPTKYKVEIENATKPFLLVFQNAFNSSWKLYSTSFTINRKNISDEYFNKEITELRPIDEAVDTNPFETNGMKSISDDKHIQVNGYANAWYIKPNQSGKYELIAEMTGQKIFYYSLIISLISLLIFILYGIKLFKKKK